MEDINYGELFGVDTGVNEQESAEPAAAEETQGATEQEVAAPAGEPDTQTGKQSAEDNAKYAAARRQAEAERDAAIEAAKRNAQEEAQRTIDEAFATAGLVNPYTGNKITSKAEYDAYKAQYDAAKRDSILSKTGMSGEEFDGYVDSLPAVKQAKEAEARANRAEAEAREAKARADIDGWIKEISALDPAVKSLEDITKQENYQTVYDYVKKGLNLTEAYKLANYDRIGAKQTAAAKQAALNAAGSKAHMTGTKSRGQGSLSVPSDEMAMFRLFNPNATDAEITEYYNKAHKKE